MDPFKFIGNKIWVFDAECVPDLDMGRRMFGDFKRERSDDDILRQMYVQCKLDPDDPNAILKPFMMKVVSISIVIHTIEDGALNVRFSTTSIKDKTEKELIQTFLEYVGKVKPQLVGFASSIFDMPLLKQRALVNGCWLPAFFARPNKPWEGIDYHGKGDYNIDLMYTVGMHAPTKPKLHEIATACRFPGKIGIDGAQVKEMYNQGKFKEIEEYNQTDAITTYLLWLRCMYTFGMFSEEQYLEAQQFLRFKIEADTENSLFPLYLDTWTALEEAEDKAHNENNDSKENNDAEEEGRESKPKPKRTTKPKPKPSATT